MSRFLRLGAAALLVAAVLVTRIGGTAIAAIDATLALTAQPYAIESGAPWTASFDVLGDLGSAVSAAPPSTAPATPSTPSTPAAPSGVSPRPVVQARIQVHRLVAERTAVRTVLDGDVPPVVSRLTVPVTLAGTAQQASFEISAPTTNDADTPGALVLVRPGLYPVSVDLLVDGDVVASHLTFVERLPLAGDDDPALQLALVATVDDPGPQADAAAVAAARAATADIADAAAAAEGAMTVRLPPSIVAGLDGPDLDAVRNGLTGVEVLAAPALALDPSSAAGAGQGDTFSGELRNGEDLLAAALPGSRPQRSAWLAAAPVSAPAAAMLREPLGFDLLVLDQATYNDLEGSIGGFHDQTLAYEVAFDDGTSLPGVIVNPASEWLDRDPPTSAERGSVDRAIAIMAELRLTRRELGAELRRSAVLTVPAGATPDPALFAALTEYAATTPGTELARLEDLAATTDVMELPGGQTEVVRLPATAGIDLGARVGRINLTRLSAAGAGSMLVDRAPADAWNSALDELVSTSLDDDIVDVRLATINAAIEAVHACVALPEPFTFTLTGRSSVLRLNLTNTCDEDLRVVVHPTSSKLAFPNGDVAATLAANDVTEVTVDVQSRSNGTSGIGIELRTPAASLTLPQTLDLTARVNALSGLGQVVTGGALLVLLSWWYGHFRKRRRARRAMLGEVDNPVHIRSVSPDAAEVAINGARVADAPVADAPVAEPPAEPPVADPPVADPAVADRPAPTDRVTQP